MSCVNIFLRCHTNLATWWDHSGPDFLSLKLHRLQSDNHWHWSLKSQIFYSLVFHLYHTFLLARSCHTINVYTFSAWGIIIANFELCTWSELQNEWVCRKCHMIWTHMQWVENSVIIIYRFSVLSSHEVRSVKIMLLLTEAWCQKNSCQHYCTYTRVLQDSWLSFCIWK